MRVILFVNPKKSRAKNLGNEISIELNSKKIDVDVFSLNEKTGEKSGEKSLLNAKERWDAAISLGGDGTVLAAARAMAPLGVPVLPLNFGTFGFIAGIHPAQWRDVFESWLNGKAHISRRLMLDVTVEREEREVFHGCCLNDAIISSSGVAKVINLNVSSGEMETVLPLGSYRSDGLIISTPTGSSAYSAAAGGPIVDPELNALILNPICPFMLTHRPMVLPAEEPVIVQVDEKQQSGVILTLDGQVIEKLKKGDILQFKKAPYHCLLVESGRRSFYQALRTKLSWVGGGNGDSR